MTSHLAVVPDQIIALCVERLSDDKTGKAEGVKTQIGNNDRTALRLGATEIHHYTDNSKSATKDGVVRGETERLMREIEDGRWDGAIVICRAQDRVTRGKSYEYVRMMSLFTEHDIRFVATLDGTDIRPSVDGSLIPGIRNEVNKEEVRKLRARQFDGMERMRSQGRRGRIPFGWSPDESAHPVEGAMVVEAIDRHLSGESLDAIAQDWNKRGLPQLTMWHRTRDGEKLPPEEHWQTVTPWNYRNISELIARPSNAGWFMHKGVRLDVTAQWEPLVSEDRWLAVKSILDARKRPGPQREHFLGGLIQCGAPGCDGVAYGVINRVRQYVYPMYRCGKCQQHSNGIDEVNDLVIGLVVARLVTMRLPDLASTALKAKMSAASDKADALRARRAETLADYAELTISKIERDTILAKIRPQLDTAEAEIERLSDGRKHALTGLTGNRAAQAWAQRTPDQQRTVIKLLMTLTLLPGTSGTPVEDRIDVKWNSIND